LRRLKLADVLDLSQGLSALDELTVRHFVRPVIGDTADPLVVGIDHPTHVPLVVVPGSTKASTLCATPGGSRQEQEEYECRDVSFAGDLTSVVDGTRLSASKPDGCSHGGRGGVKLLGLLRRVTEQASVREAN
jgi:hypothetical protein